MSTYPTIRHLKKVKQQKIAPLPDKKPDIFGQLTPKQEEFVETYLLFHYLSDAAEQIGVSERTARRWLDLPVVIEAIEMLRQERRQAIQDKIQTSLDLATDLIHRALRDAVYPDRPDARFIDHGRVDTYIAFLFKYAHDEREADALKLRIAKLEAELNSAKAVVDGTVTHSDEEG